MKDERGKKLDMIEKERRMECWKGKNLILVLNECKRRMRDEERRCLRKYL